MSRIYVLLFASLFLWSCSGNGEQEKQKPIYSEEKLLMDYLEKYHQGEISQNEYVLFTFRTANICRTCRSIPLDTVLKYAILEHQNTNFYILTDNQKDKNLIESQYGEQVKCLFGDALTINRYGIPELEPLLFEIKNKKIVSLSNYYK